MILADTSVWIEFLRPQPSKIKEKLASFIKDNNQICISGLVIQEILQGVKNQKTSQELEEELLGLPYFECQLTTYLKAASIYKKLLLKGFQIHTVDAIIAALCLENNLYLFTSDKHFEKIARFEKLKLIN